MAQGAAARPGRSGQRSREWCEEEEDDPDLWGHRVSKSSGRERGASLGRGKRSDQEGGGERKGVGARGPLGWGKEEGEAARVGG
jgi:hypothetical protein